MPAIPLVSGIMVTGTDKNRLPLAIAACRSFSDQTWPTKELVIVNDGGWSLIAELPPDLRKRFGDNIREIQPAGKRTLGALRNIGLAEMRGEYAVQFDDDDWSHPARIAYQMQFAKPGHCVLLKWQVRYAFKHNAAFAAHRKDGIPGTILHHKDSPRYRHLGRREDMLFVKSFGTRCRKANNAPGTPMGPELYLRFWHGSNTWSIKHVMAQSGRVPRQNTWVLTPAATHYLRETLSTHYGENR